MPFRQLAIAAALVVTLAAAPARADMVHLTMQSEPGDYVGSGRNYDEIYDSLRGDFVSGGFLLPQVTGRPTFLRFHLNHETPIYTDRHSVGLDFDTGLLGTPLQPGYYPVFRPTVQSPRVADLRVSYQSHTVNQAYGSFTIRELTYEFNSRGFPILQSFDAEFEQRAESPAAPALRGRIQFTASNAPTSVPAPAPVALLVSGAVAMGFARFRRSR